MSSGSSQIGYRYHPTSCLGTMILECLVSSVAGRLDILDPKESLGVLKILCVFVDLVQTSYTIPAFLEASVESRFPPATSLFLISQPIQRITHTKNRHKIFQGDFSLFLTTMDFKAFVLLCSQACLTTVVGKKKSVCTELLPWPSYILHLWVRHQQALTS